MDAGEGTDSPEDIRMETEICQKLFIDCLSHPLFYELEELENRQGQFNLWAAGLKATSTGRSSLDYRVRDHPEMRVRIYSLLLGLSEALHDLLDKGMSYGMLTCDLI
jgi:hypothetical protein